MKEKWTGDIIGKMHVHDVTMVDLAAEMNVTKAYVCMILNGSRKPPMAKERIEDAYKSVLEKRKTKRAAGE